MRVLITGGAGYIGTELCYKLSESEEVEQILVYDNLSRPNYNLFIGKSKLKNKLKFIQGDILDSRRLIKHLKETDVVVHLAAMVSTPFAEQSPHSFEQINHWGTAELIYALEECKNIKKLIYLSSVSVYGASNKEVDVDCELNPRTFYGISKMRGEDHVYRLFNSLPCFIARCGNVYGYSKSMRFDAVINRFMFDANYNGRISINGNGEQHRSFIHVHKVTSVLDSIIHNDSLKSNRFDLVDKVISINEIANTIQEIYPEMERLFINQHMDLRELRVSPNDTINQMFISGNLDLKDELLKFKQEFTWNN